jgi:transposase
MLARIYIGIDISKDWFDACGGTSLKAPVRRFTQSPEGLLQFFSWVKELGARTCRVCMEHTGGYETVLAIACKEAGLAVSLVDGALISRYRGSFSRGRAKTDKNDARLLARYCRERRPAEWAPRPEPYRQLTELVRHRQDLIDGKRAWGCRASNPCQNELVVKQRESLRQVLALEIAEVEEAIKVHVKSCPELQEDVELLDSIEGIAFKSAVRILAEMGPVANYRSARDLAFHAGLTPVPYESGKSTGKCFLPTYGNRELRNALYWPVVVAMRCDHEFATFTKRVNANGNKLKMTVITAGMRKLAHLVFGVLNSRKAYSAQLFLKHMRQRG